MENVTYSAGGIREQVDTDSSIVEVSKGHHDGPTYIVEQTYRVHVRTGHHGITAASVASGLAGALSVALCRHETFDLRVACETYERTENAFPGAWLRPLPATSASEP